MLTRATRWFLIGAPVIAGILLMVFGTEGATSQAFGGTLIAIGLCIWMVNFFIRMTFNETARETEADAREERARGYGAPIMPLAAAPVPRPAPPPARPDSPEPPAADTPIAADSHTPVKRPHPDAGPGDRRRPLDQSRRRRRPS